MKKSRLFLSFVLLGIVAVWLTSSGIAAPPDSDLVGKWKLQATMAGETKDYEIEFKLEDEKLTGTLFTPEGDSIPLSKVSYADGTLKFTVSAPDGDYETQATVNGKKMSGHFKTPSGESGDVEATKA